MSQQPVNTIADVMMASLVMAISAESLRAKSVVTKNQIFVHQMLTVLLILWGKRMFANAVKGSEETELCVLRQVLN